MPKARSVSVENWFATQDRAVDFTFARMQRRKPKAEVKSEFDQRVDDRVQKEQAQTAFLLMGARAILGVENGLQLLLSRDVPSHLAEAYKRENGAPMEDFHEAFSHLMSRATHPESHKRAVAAELQVRKGNSNHDEDQDGGGGDRGATAQGDPVPEASRKSSLRSGPRP